LPLWLFGERQHCNGQTLKHAYTFEYGTWSGTTIQDQVSTNPVNGTVNGNDWEIKKGYFINHNSIQAAGATMGGYISFDGTALALNTYSSVVLEAYLTTNADQNNLNKWSVLAYFGGVSGANSFMLQPEISGANTKAGVNNTKFAVGTEAGANQTHHYVAALVPAIGKTETYPNGKPGRVMLYYDGVLAQSTALDTTTYKTVVSALGTTNAYLGKGAWTDALFTQPVHEFNIYDGGLDSVAIANFVSTRYTAINSKLSALAASVGTIYPAFNGEVYDYNLLLPTGTSSVDLSATPVNGTFTVNGIGTIDVSRAESGVVTVKASNPGAVPYTIRWVKEVITPELKHSYTFTDGTAKDVVNNANGTLVGANAAIGNGAFTISGTAGNVSVGTISYLDLPASSLALNTYPVITLEAVVKTGAASGYFAYFGNETKQNGTDYLYIFSGSTKISCNKNHDAYRGEIAAAGADLKDSKVHHVVAILKQDSIVLYQDGIKKASTALGTNVNNRICNLSAAKAFLGRSGYYGDLNWLGSIGEFNVYKGRVPEATIVSRATAYLKDTTLSVLTVSAGSLVFDPATKSYNVVLPIGTTSVNEEATAAKDFAVVAGTGSVDVSTGSGIASVVVTSADATKTGTYKVNFIVGTPTDVNDALAENVSVKANQQGQIEVVSRSNGTFTIYNTAGQIVAFSKITNAVTIVEGVKQSGVYVVVVSVNGGQITKKVVIK
jgi:hypothetical protein